MRERRPIIITEATARTTSSPTTRSARRSRRSSASRCWPASAPIGALEVGTLFPRKFTDDEVDLLQLTADRAALAIERVRLLERQQTIAEELQRSLLPQSLPAVPGLAMAARYLPGGAGTRVGGDWYDTIPLPGGRVALVIGDVAGRGVDAAAMMGQLRSALRAYILEGATPAEALERLNRFMLSLAWDSMATASRAAARAGDRPHGVRERRPSARRTCSSPDGVARSLTEPLGVPLGALDAVDVRARDRRCSSRARRSCSTPTASSSSATS